MFETYSASKKDLRKVEKGITFVWKGDLDYIFENKGKIKNTAILSYDSQFLYLWATKNFKKVEKIKSNLKNYQLYKIPHRVKITEKLQEGWSSYLREEKFKEYLPTELKIDKPFSQPLICGGLATPFKTLQKQKGTPYTTDESYLATIVHEFGHVYYKQHKLWWYSNKKDNLTLLETARKLYQNNSEQDKKSHFKKTPSLYIPHPAYISELFAFCTDYSSAQIFWPKHKKDLDSYHTYRIENLIEKEKNKNLLEEDSVLDSNAHDFAAVFGKILTSRHPKSWPRILLSRTSIK